MKENLLLLHGALGSKNQFNRLIKELTNHYNIHTFNFEGHGGRASEKKFSIDLFSSNVESYLLEQAINKTNIFGYSMGGYVALKTATKIPHKISKITTLGTKFDWRTASAAKEVKMLNPIIVEEKVPHFAAKLNRDHFPLDWKIVMNKTAEMMLDMAKGATLTDQDLQSIQIPVSIGIGTLDKMVSYEESEHVSRLLPNAHLVSLEDIQHPIEKIENTVLINFIVSH